MISGDKSRTVADLCFGALKHLRHGVVFAESCTGGAAAAAMARWPGASEVLCGSFVTYQSESKVAWLGLKPKMLARHTPESPQAAKAMAARALRLTPHARWSVAVVGHMGPGAPPDKDGEIFLCCAYRGRKRVKRRFRRYRCAATFREPRQQEAVRQVFDLLWCCMSKWRMDDIADFVVGGVKEE